MMKFCPRLYSSVGEAATQPIKFNARSLVFEDIMVFREVGEGTGKVAEVFIGFVKESRSHGSFIGFVKGSRSRGSFYWICERQESIAEY
jgi:hypothetical protein